MIARLLKGPEADDLTWCAVMFTLVACVLLIPGIMLGLLLDGLAPALGRWRIGVPAILWTITVAATWIDFVVRVRASPHRHVSTRGLTAIWACGVATMAIMLPGAGDDRWPLLLAWLITLDVATVLFFLALILLALSTWTRIPWRAWGTLAFTCLTLGASLRSCRFP